MDLHGGTIVPGFIDAHAHPVFAGDQMRLSSILAAYTSGSARVNGLDAATGSIREGFDADFAIVNADLARLPAQDICGAEVTQTWIRGQVAYQQQ